MAATNVALLYGDDVAFYNVFSQIKNAAEASTTTGTAVAMIAAGGLSAVTQVLLARKNQNFASEESETDMRMEPSEYGVQSTGFIERMRNRVIKAKQHTGKLAVSLTVGGANECIKQETQ